MLIDCNGDKHVANLYYTPIVVNYHLNLRGNKRELCIIKNIYMKM